MTKATDGRYGLSRDFSSNNNQLLMMANNQANINDSAGNYPYGGAFGRET